MKINIIGGGLAGVECAFYLANKGYKVNLFDMKPEKLSPAHKNTDLAELVCSNSLKSNDVYGNACGLLKEELRMLNSLCIGVADGVRVPAGNALAVNREDFAKKITEKVKSHQNITYIGKEVKELEKDAINVIATGPLTSEDLSETLSALTGENLYFFDAASPIVSKDSIDFDYAFYGDRYNKGNGDHINCPMEKDVYEELVKELVNAKKAPLKDFDKRAVFDGCMPIEVMAERGIDTLRFGTLKPVGLYDPRTNKRGYACLQLRREDKDGNMFNLVGCQTNLLFPEQKRVFGLIPALKNAEYLRYGVMHKNTFINSPKLLNKDLSLKSDETVYFAGQITGVEGYVESMATGLLVGINIDRRLSEKKALDLNNQSMLGALVCYITEAGEDFQPMNANFGILKPLEETVRDKALKKRMLSERALKITKEVFEIE